MEGGRLKLGVGSLTLPMTTWLLGVIVFYWSRHPSAYREETRFRRSENITLYRPGLISNIDSDKIFTLVV